MKEKNEYGGLIEKVCSNCLGCTTVLDQTYCKGCGARLKYLINEKPAKPTPPSQTKESQTQRSLREMYIVTGKQI